jgi:hypothetical protein
MKPKLNLGVDFLNVLTTSNIRIGCCFYCYFSKMSDFAMSELVFNAGERRQYL